MSLPSYADEPIGVPVPSGSEARRAHVAEGITYPPIDDLLDKAGSKYQLVLYAAKRARQINAYYSQLGEGLLEYVGPLVETHVQEKPLSIALREIDAGLLTYTPGAEDIDPAPHPVLDAAAADAAFSDLGPDFGSFSSADTDYADFGPDFPGLTAEGDETAADEPSDAGTGAAVAGDDADAALRLSAEDDESSGLDDSDS